MAALRGLRVVEMAGLAPAPFAGMILADFGASVIRVDKMSDITVDSLARGKRSIAVNLKQPEGVQVVRRLCAQADVLIEPYRPGVMERAGLGPQTLLADNPRLVYARLTGFGQTGPLAPRAGHDINYLAVSGVLSMFRRPEDRPLPPVNILGDFAAGGMLCAMGIMAALLERGASGCGQVIDSSMVDGAAYLSSFIHKSNHLGIWGGPPGTNMLDGGAPFYDTYETKDGKFVAVGAIEPEFYSALLEGMGLDPSAVPAQNDRDAWPETRKKFAAVFASRPRAEWEAVFHGTDACVTPILEPAEAAAHPHCAARHVFSTAAGQVDPAPAPRLSRTPAQPATTGDLLQVGRHTREILAELGYDAAAAEALLSKGAVKAAANAKL